MADFSPKDVRISWLRDYKDLGYKKREYVLVNTSSIEIKEITINIVHHIPGVYNTTPITLNSVKPGERREFGFQTSSLDKWHLKDFSGVLADGRVFRDSRRVTKLRGFWGKGLILVMVFSFIIYEIDRYHYWFLGLLSFLILLAIILLYLGRK